MKGIRRFLCWMIAGLWVTVGPVPAFGQAEGVRVVPLDTAAVRDSVRVLLERAERLASRITPPDSLHFGYEIFGLGPGVSEPPALGAVDPGYPIGPGDEILITVWGQVELSYTLTVDRGGGVAIPKMGRLQVSGVPLGELQGRISRFLARGYAGISEEAARATTFVDVSLGRLRSIQVFVVGEVRRPGSYILNATSTVLNALYRAGGPTPKGSLREIRLVRHDRTVRAVDFYRFVLEGDKQEDVRLQNGDVVLVPPVGKEVRLKGRVHRPAIYELKPEEGLTRLIEIAGGLEPDAYAGRVQIERVAEGRGRGVVDVDLDGARRDSDRDVALQDGDVVTVFEVGPRIENAVYVEGYVQRPGRYQLRSGMRVSDLIREADGVLPEAFPGRADVVRTNPDLTRDLVRFHLRRALEGDSEADLPLQPQDVVKVYSIHTFGLEAFVTIQGRVKRPGRYELLAGMTVKDLIVLAGGLDEGAHRSAVEVSRVVGDSTAPVRVFQVAVEDDYSLDGRADGFALRNRDMVFVRPDPNFEPQRNVKIEGEVVFPGTYTLQERQERLSSLIARSGGLLETAFLEGVRFYRAPVNTGAFFATLGGTSNGNRDEARLIAVDLKEALKRAGSGADPILADGDSIVVPRDPGVVRVTGEVFYPRMVRFEKGKDAGYYIEQAGGLTPQADRGRIYVILANGQVEKKGRWGWPEVTSGSRIVAPARPLKGGEEGEIRIKVER